MPRWRAPDLTKAQHEILDSIDRIEWDGISILESIEAARVHNFKFHKLTFDQLAVALQRQTEPRKYTRKH